MDQFPVGLEMEVVYPQFEVSLTLLSTERLKFEIKKGPFARTEIVDIHVVPLSNGIFVVSWQEKDGATVPMSRTSIAAGFIPAPRCPTGSSCG